MFSFISKTTIFIEKSIPNLMKDTLVNISKINVLTY